jgi:hypothetical protein
MFDIETGFVSSVPRGETLIPSERIPVDHRSAVVVVRCLLGSCRCGREAQRWYSPVARGNRPASGPDLDDRRGAAVAIAARVSCGNPAFCQSLRYASRGEWLDQTKNTDETLPSCVSVR